MINIKRMSFSQNGEDGIIEEICRCLQIKKGEFGAWNGKYLSSSFNLLSKGWQGIYIEGNKKKHN